jgi:SAM-dependent methyltransferase
MRWIIDYFRFAWQLVVGIRLKMELNIDRMRQDDIANYLVQHKLLDILDLANGRLRPQYTILNSRGQHVVGIDLINQPVKNPTEIAYQLARWIYRLGLRTTDPPNHQHDLVCGDVGYLSFGDCSFDLITSVAALEHFLEIRRVIFEIWRVLRPGGVAWIAIHPFTSLSGGHNVSLCEVPLVHIPKEVDPWDHLRLRKLPFHVPLNEWRIHQYLEAFSAHFEILKHYCAMREGDQLLTPEIEAELVSSGYTRDELTCGAYVIVARKKPIDN